MFEPEFDLTPYNTFGFSTHAKRGRIITSTAALKDALKTAAEKQFPIIILGCGSNVVLLRDLEVMALIIRISGIEVLKTSPDHVVIRVGAGMIWDDLVAHTLKQGWYGLENLSLIPGTVGACPIQNVGAYGVEVKDFFQELTAIDRTTRKEVILDGADCEFGYRDSIFKQSASDRYVITSVTFKLWKTPQLNLSYPQVKQAFSSIPSAEQTPQWLRHTIIQLRRSKLPDVATIGNAGSFFTNPIVAGDICAKIKRIHPDLVYHHVDDHHAKISAGWLVERCGWRGYQDPKGVGVYTHNALVLVNHGPGTGVALMALAKQIQESVIDQFGITLTIEPRIYV